MEWLKMSWIQKEPRNLRTQQEHTFAKLTLKCVGGIERNSCEKISESALSKMEGNKGCTKT
jgi:hypothetical protein